MGFYVQLTSTKPRYVKSTEIHGSNQWCVEKNTDDRIDTGKNSAPTLTEIQYAVSELHYQNAIIFLISAIAFPGFNPLGQVRAQFIIVWHRYRLILLSSIALRSSLCSSRESVSQR